MNAQQQKPQDWGELIASQDTPYQPEVNRQRKIFQHMRRRIGRGADASRQSLWTNPEAEFIWAAINAGASVYDATGVYTLDPELIEPIKKMLAAGATWRTACERGAWALYRAAHAATTINIPDIEGTTRLAAAAIARHFEWPTGLRRQYMDQAEANIKAKLQALNAGTTSPLDAIIKALDDADDAIPATDELPYFTDWTHLEDMVALIIAEATHDPF